jgi:hypothetical protein
VAVAQVRDAGLQFAALRHLPVNDGLALGAVADVVGRVNSETLPRLPLSGPTAP